MVSNKKNLKVAYYTEVHVKNDFLNALYRATLILTCISGIKVEVAYSL